MKRYVYAISLLLILTGCDLNRKQEMSLSTQTIALDSACQEIMPGVVDSISFVKLEENDDSYFASISKLRMMGDTIIVFDRMGKNTLLGFNIQGDYLHSFGQKGNGPNEYVRLWDFDIDSNYVYLYDRAKKKMLYYDHQGRFIQRKTTAFIGDGFKTINEGRFLFSLAKAGSNMKLCITDSLLRIEQSILSYREDEADDKITDNLFFASGTEIMYNKPVCDSIYTLSQSGELQGCYKISFGNYGVPKEIVGSYEKITEYESKKKYCFMHDCPLVTNNLIVGSIFHQGAKATLIIDLKTNKNYINDWVEGVKIANIILPVYANARYIVGWMDYEVYNAASDKELLSPDMVKHLKNGGKILIFYHLNRE